MNRRIVYALLAVFLPTFFSTAFAQKETAPSNRTAKVKTIADDAFKFLREQGQDKSGAFTPRMGSGITSLVVTAALRHGRSVDDPLVADGLKAIEVSIQDDGGIYGNGRLKNYETCVAITCLAEANKAAGDGRYDEALENAEAFVRGLQIGSDGNVGPEDPEYGGVGYSGRERPDLSNTAYLMEALHSVGAEGDDPAMQRALAFVSRCQNLDAQWNDTQFAGKVNDGGFYYVIPTEAVDPSEDERYTANGGLRSYGSMTYSGFKSLVYAGLKKDDPRAKAALDWICKHYTLENNPGQGDAGLYYYYNTFGVALAASELEEITTDGGEKHNWRGDLVAELAERQQDNGSWVSSNRRGSRTIRISAQRSRCWRCRIVTDEATLGESEPAEGIPCVTAGSSSSAKRVPGAHCWTSQQWRPALLLNALLLAAGAVWLWSAPTSYKTVERLTLSSPGALSATSDWVIAVCLVGATGTLLTTSWGFLRGSPRQRSIAAYLAFTALVGGWLALVTGWEAVYGWGQARRVLADLPAFETAAQRLDAAWPADDGTAGGFGPFMAYPKDRPTCLLMLGQAKPPGGSLQVSAVERSAGAVRFELVGAERPAWVVWHAQDAPAEAFTSGLGGEYAVTSQRRLAPHWRLVRYTLVRESAPRGAPGDTSG